MELIIIIIVVLIILAYVSSRKRPQVGLLPGKSLEDGSVVFLGTADSLDAAKTMAGAVEGAKSVVYYSASAGDYAKMVYAVKRNSPYMPAGDQYTVSPLIRKEGFDAKSFMRLPGHDAGESLRSSPTKGSFDAMVQNRFRPEHLQAKPDVAANTVWAGYMKPSWEHMLNRADVASNTVWAGYMKPTWQNAL